MKNERKRALGKALVCGFLLTLAASFFPFGASCAMLPQSVMRLHVVANSDAPEDQAVKLKVRDAVLEEAAKWVGEADSLEKANFALCTHLESIQEAANRALLENGFPETARTQVTDMYFSTRDYESFRLPAGKYRTLRVTIGEGKGKNWWCVVFPALCLPAAEASPDDLLSTLPERERDIVSHPGKYRIKFKAVELYEQLRRWLEGE